MMRLRLLILTFLISTLSYSQNGEWIWVNDFLLSHSFLTEKAGGGFLISGMYNPDSNFTDPPINYYDRNYNAFMIQYDKHGNWDWFNCFGWHENLGYSASMSHAVQSESGDYYLNFEFGAPYVMGIDTFFSEETAWPDAVIARYNYDGDLEWYTRFKRDTTVEIYTAIKNNYMCIDNNEEIYLTGRYTGKIIIDDTTLISDGSTYICKLEYNGNLSWLNEFDFIDNRRVEYNSVSDNIILSGIIYEDFLAYDGDTIQAIPNHNVFIASLNKNNGKLENYSLFPGYFSDGSNPGLQLMDIDNEGYIYFRTDHINDTIVLGNDTIYSVDQDCILWKISPDLNIVWYRHITGFGNQNISEIKVNSTGEVFASLICYHILIYNGDTIWNEPTTSTRGIIHVNASGEYQGLIGVNVDKFETLNFTLSNNGIIVYGKTLEDSIGIWDVDDYFIGKYNISNINIEENKKIDIQLFPNPSKEYINLLSDNMIEDLFIYSISGQLVKNKRVNSNSVNISILDLNSGNYFIRVLTNKGILVKKFVVIR